MLFLFIPTETRSRSTTKASS